MPATVLEPARHEDAIDKAARLIASAVEAAGAPKDDIDPASVSGGGQVNFAALARVVTRALPSGFQALVGRLGDGSYDDGEAALVRLVDVAEDQVRHAEHLGLFASSGSGLQQRPDGHKMPAVAWAVSGDLGADIDSVTALLERIDAAAEAAHVALHITMSESRHAQSYRHAGASSGKFCREDLLAACLGFIKTQTINTVMRSVALAAISEEQQTDEIKQCQAVINSHDVKRLLSHITAKICACIESLASLGTLAVLNEQLIISLVYFLVPLFSTDASRFDSDIGVESLLVHAMRMLVVLFSKYPAQRTFILDEIMAGFSSLGTAKKTQRLFRLADGRSVSLISALLLQLLQSCGAAVSLGARDSEPSDDDTKPDDADEVSSQPVNPQESSAQTDAAVRGKKLAAQSKEVAESASLLGSYVVKYLLGRCTSNPDDKDPAFKSDPRRRVGTTEAEFRAVLDIFFRDLLCLVGSPDWPVADVVAGRTTQMMIHLFDDSFKHADLTTMRSIALDWLGTAGARVVAMLNEWPQFRSSAGLAGVPSPSSAGGDAKALAAAQAKLVGWLCREHAQDPLALKSIVGMLASKWIVSLSPGEDAAQPSELVLSVSELVSLAVSGDDKLWSLAENLSHSDAAALAAGLCVTQSTHALRDSIVHCICSGIGADSVALRTRALKSLQEVLVGNSSLLLTSSIRRVIGERLLDSSANVRDAAVDVLGKYVLAGGDETLKQYYPVLCDRVMDVSPIVRKRTLRLLRDFCASVGELAEPTDAHADMAVDVTVRMLGRMHDDSSVADLAFKCFSELWLQTARPVDVADAAAWQALAETEKAAVRWIVRCLTRVASKSNAVSMLLGETLTKAVKSATKQTRPALHAHVHALVLCTVDQLLVSYEQSRMDGIVAHLALLLRLSDIAPELVSPHLFTLHPFIKPSRAAHAPNSPEAAQELQIVQSVLVIFVNVLPMIREPDPTLVAAVETDLLQLLNRSPQGVIQSAVPCVCTIVAKHTRNVAKLARVVVTCYDMLEKHKAVCEQTGSLPPNSLRTAWRCMILLSLVLRYYDFSDDKNMRGEYNIPEIQAIAKGTPLSTRAFDLIHSFIARSSSPETTIVVLTCLGNLFMSHPRLMLTDTTIALFSRVFAGKDAKEKRQLLVILAEFLEREQTAKAERPGEMADRAVLTSDPFAPPSKKARRDEQPIDMSVLVGNAEEFAEAGIASSIVQRFLQPVIDCVLSGHAQLLSTGFQVLQLIVDQGLVHPILVVPALCAIASLDDAVLATRAASLHQRLAEKHASFIHSKNMEAVRCIYEFHGRQLYVGGAKPQSALVPGHVVVSLQTETGTAAHLESRIARVYALVRPTRNKRNEFLRGLVRLFEVDKKESRIESLGFLLFVADCLVVLDYKTTDEVLLVLHCINRILSLAGDASFDEARELADDAAEQHTAPLMARVLVLTALMIVRHQLQQCYGLTDARCVAYNPASVTSKAAEKPLGHPVTPVAAVDWRQILTSSALKWPAAAEQIAQCKRAEAFASRIAAHAVADAGGGGGDTSSNASAGYRNGFSSDATGPSDEDDAASEHRRRLPDTIAVGGASDAASGAAGQPAKRRRTDGRGQQKQQHIKLKQQKPLVAPPPPLRRGGKRDATGRVARGDGFGLLSSETDGDVDPLTAGSGLAGDVSGTAGRGGGASKRRRSSIVAS